MTENERTEISLSQIPADRRLVEELYSHGKITGEARRQALAFLYPDELWGLWVARILLAIGVTLMLTGVVFFFAFNWASITPLIKFSSIQIAIATCLIGAYYFSLQQLNGQILLLSASVLVGVFLAVFGQIYQTGADSYQLFMVWSLLIFGWTLISTFATQWIIWLVITNIFLILWWDQAALPTREMEFMIFTYLTILNGFALVLREYFSVKSAYHWLEGQWLRLLLVVTTITVFLIPVVALILEPDKASQSILLSGVIGLIGHGAAYLYYRYKLPDMWSLAAIVLSCCIIVEALAFRILTGERLSLSGAGSYLIMGFLTLGIFTVAIIYLRSLSTKLESSNV